MIKPVGATCNLNCTYCYYLHNEGLLGGSSKFHISDDIFEELIRQYAEGRIAMKLSFPELTQLLSTATVQELAPLSVVGHGWGRTSARRVLSKKRHSVSTSTPSSTESPLPFLYLKENTSPSQGQRVAVPQANGMAAQS